MNHTLTAREYEAVELTAYGLSKDEIAEQMGISKFTADQFVRRAKEKLKLNKATELSAWYYTRRYGITLNISDRLRRVVSAALLSLVLYTFFINTDNMLRPQRPNARTAQRAQRGGRRNGKRGDDYDFTEYDNNETDIA